MGCTAPILMVIFDGNLRRPHLPGSLPLLSIGKFLYPALGPFGLNGMSENLEIRWLEMNVDDGVTTQRKN